MTNITGSTILEQELLLRPGRMMAAHVCS